MSPQYFVLRGRPRSIHLPVTLSSTQVVVVLPDNYTTALRICLFFFSSRRRHTRYWRDWSSDVCSSDLTALQQLRHLRAAGATVVWQPFYLGYSELAWAMQAMPAVFDPARSPAEREQLLGRSEERRVGKECRSRWSPDH